MAVKLLLYQHEVNTCPELKGEDAIHVTPLSTCSLSVTRGTLLHPRGEYIEVLKASGKHDTVLCGNTLAVNGLRVYISCLDYPSESYPSSIDAVLVYAPVWTARGDALREARRLTYRLMAISFLAGAPVVYVNRWGVSGERVYVGATGLYDYAASLPLSAGGYGDTILSIRLPRQRLDS